MPGPSASVDRFAAPSSIACWQNTAPRVSAYGLEQAAPSSAVPPGPRFSEAPAATAAAVARSGGGGGSAAGEYEGGGGGGGHLPGFSASALDDASQQSLLALRPTCAGCAASRSGDGDDKDGAAADVKEQARVSPPRLAPLLAPPPSPPPFSPFGRAGSCRGSPSPSQQLSGSQVAAEQQASPLRPSTAARAASASRPPRRGCLLDCDSQDVLQLAAGTSSDDSADAAPPCAPQLPSAAAAALLSPPLSAPSAKRARRGEEQAVAAAVESDEAPPCALSAQRTRGEVVAAAAAAPRYVTRGARRLREAACEVSCGASGDEP